MVLLLRENSNLGITLISKYETDTSTVHLVYVSVSDTWAFSRHQERGIY